MNSKNQHSMPGREITPLPVYERPMLSNCWALLALAWSLAVLAYVALRASMLSFTHDEGLTFTILRNIPFWRTSTNNHLLNTLLMKVMQVLFGESELALRLPNVLSCVLYLYSCRRILGLITSRPWMQTAGFFLLTSNPYVLDFFSLARGYGLAVAFMTAATYLLIRSTMETEEQSIRSLWFASVWASLATWSNYGMLNFYICVLAASFGLRLLSAKRDVISRRPLVKLLPRKFLLYNCLNLTLLVAILCFLKQRGQMFFGGRTGIVHDTLQSLVECSFYYHKPSDGILNGIAWTVIITYLVIAALAISNSTRERRITAQALLVLLPGWCVLAHVCQFLLLKQPYPTDRMCVYLYPLFVLCVVGAVAAARPRRIIPGVVLGLAACLMTAHAVRVANCTYCYNWQFDANTKQMIMDLVDDGAANGRKSNVYLKLDYIFFPAARYYCLSRKIDWLIPEPTDVGWRDTPGADVPYEPDYFYDRDGANAIWNSCDGVGEVRTYPSTETSLMRRR